MEEKLRKLMSLEGINSSRLAEMLGIQASGISHIMSGRNKPSYDFLIKLLNRFPQINPDWLLLDKGPMYRNEVKGKSTAIQPNAIHPDASSGKSDLFSVNSGNSVNSSHQIADHLERDDKDIIPDREQPYASATFPQASAETSVFRPSSSIERIVVFYKDKTFTEYQPE